MYNDLDIAINDPEVEEVLQKLGYVKLQKDGAYYKSIVCNNTTLYERIIKHHNEYLYSSYSIHPINHNVEDAILLTKETILNKSKGLNGRNSNKVNRT